jgi:hypothetical protein
MAHLQPTNPRLRQPAAAAPPVLQPEEGLYTADYVDPARILDTKMPRIYFAGSYVKNRYPIDSAEGACLTGLSAVTALRCDRKHEQATAH